MKTECAPVQIEFTGLGRRKVLGTFDGGLISSDGGAVLLREVDARLGITEKLAACFTDYHDPDLIEHDLLALVRQGVYGVALGYEDFDDHDDLKWEPLWAVALNKKDLEGQARHREADRGKVLASSSTLNRLELSDADEAAESRYKKMAHDPENWKRFSSMYSSIRLPKRPRRSCWTLTRRTTRCMAIRRVSFFTATTAAIATCLCT